MGNKLQGEKRHNSILDEEKVKEMRRLNSEQGIGKKKLAELFGVSPSVAYRVIKRQSWKHVE